MAIPFLAQSALIYKIVFCRIDSTESSELCRVYVAKSLYYLLLTTELYDQVFNWLERKLYNFLSIYL